MPSSTSRPNRTEKAERLNKFLAFQLRVSRRQADNLIAKQKVYINNQPAQLGARIGESDTITINNHIVGGRSRYTYLMLNKPINYVCSRKQQGKTPTIYSLLPDKFHNLKPVGRLDANSSGLLLLTNDGDFAFRMTHPKFKKNKQYNVTLDKELAPLHQQMIADFGKPIVSTSANISGEPTPLYYQLIDPKIIAQCDYVVPYRQDDTQIKNPSRLIRFDVDGEILILR